MSANLHVPGPANLPPIGLAVPSSWYCLGLSRDLAAGQVWRRTLAGQELVVFRTATGQLASLGAYCPHLGADLGVGGKVEGGDHSLPVPRLLFWRRRQLHLYALRQTGATCSQSQDRCCARKARAGVWLARRCWGASEF